MLRQSYAHGVNGYVLEPCIREGLMSFASSGLLLTPGNPTICTWLASGHGSLRVDRRQCWYAPSLQAYIYHH
jgi:hypothetical protein